MYRTERFDLKKGSKDAAGYDICTLHDVIVVPGQNVISTGITVEIPVGFYGQLASRSGLASKGFLVMGGVIDSDYRGEVKVLLFNLNGDSKKFEAGDRIAQLIILPLYNMELVKATESTSLSETVRGSDGFGSTGLSEVKEISKSTIFPKEYISIPDKIDERFNYRNLIGEKKEKPDLYQILNKVERNLTESMIGSDEKAVNMDRIVQQNRLLEEELGTAYEKLKDEEQTSFGYIDGKLITRETILDKKKEKNDIKMDYISDVAPKCKQYYIGGFQINDSEDGIFDSKVVDCDDESDLE